MTKNLTLAEAAAALGRDPSTLRRQIRRGVLRATRFGKAYAITERAVEDYRRDHLRHDREETDE